MGKMQSSVVIVGGTSGIGLATALNLFEKGNSVVVTGRDSARIESVRNKHPGLTAHAVDASVTKDLTSFFENVGPISDLVLCVSGAKGAGVFRDLCLEDLALGFQEKFFTQVRAAQMALPFLLPQGSITFVTAISARAANPGTAGLAAINGAIEAMIKPLAKELMPMRVNAVSPGVVETSWWDKMPLPLRDNLLAESAAKSLVGRNAQASELAHAITFLIENHFVTGTVLEVDGGLRLS